MVPRWSSLARSGQPGPDALWPFDPELAQLELGLRRAIKRETRAEPEAEVALEWFAAHALEVTRQGSVLFAATEQRALNRAAEADRAGDRDAQAVRELGELLGYPRCCVERYLSLGVRDDAALFDALLTPGPAPVESLWLAGGLALIAHAPCGLRCAPTLELGRATLAALESKHPGFATRWRELATGLHQVDERGRVFATLASGVLEILADPVPRVAPVREAPSPIRWSADHRG